MIRLHQLRFNFKKYWILVIPVAVLVLFSFVFFNSADDRISNNLSDEGSVNLFFTPFPTMTYVSKTPSPNQTLVPSDGIFESYIVDNTLQRVFPSESPARFNADPTHLYYTIPVPDKPRGLLRITKVSNASYRPLKYIVDLEISKRPEALVSYGKYNDYHSARIVFKGADLRSFWETAIVSVPGVFYFFTYAEKIGDRSEQDTMQVVHTYLNNFMAGYDWIAVRSNSRNADSMRFFDTRIQDEIEYIRHRSSTPPAFDK